MDPVPYGVGVVFYHIPHIVFIFLPAMIEHKLKASAHSGADLARVHIKS